MAGNQLPLLTAGKVLFLSVGKRYRQRSGSISLRVAILLKNHDQIRVSGYFT